MPPRTPFGQVGVQFLTVSDRWLPTFGARSGHAGPSCSTIGRPS